ncbi:MBL fold metallo-hydrolase [Salegentibacter salegens]|uniref:Glyoxylase, beta-lactamase superfamily II n=1 Tax=Salegentibacter salegens TaxID=143223 RepID=A0A1M7LIU6_9FLAO|nr:MBL fold metallo-hydrolase [Salegentibacter salegens]PRX50686.1 glyoxylase-like metal-dependent hydrolase (beta-lactamase superfamily II) [Salegentibacter salegens]SHM78060.1 Glyoxylase, beta-lactamase superfamily II [Salegentibacter salegens]
MKIKQFKDDPLAHYSYALVSDGEMALVDPSRNPMQYYKYAEENNAKIVAVFETHPHADFVSGHLQIQQETGSTIYISKNVGVEYTHTPFDEGDEVKIGDASIKAIHTPGHSPDSLTFIAEENGETIMFSGDTLFIGDVGRPDLREKAGNMKAKRVELAKQMYNTMQTKFNELPDDTIIYPAHGAGSLCGKNMSDASSSTLGNERQGNWAFKDQTEEEFVEEILKDQPFIPAYFGFSVELNRKGALNVQKAKYEVPVKLYVDSVEKEGITVVDTRDGDAYKKGHLPNSINIMARSESDKYETWLGAIIEPEEEFYLVAESVDQIDDLLERTAKIGYEKQMKGVVTLSEKVSKSSDEFNLEDFKANKDKYTIVDIRNESEIAEGKIFDDAKAIPLNELRNRTDELPGDKPFMVHCAGGYRSAAGSSILENKFKNTKVYDLSEAIKEFS